ncbi:MAG: hypothetical protein FE048_05450 [Thermoplasmata archaeon]|nr:MAG: hypothetical protein FE048_05450 [Thermoplasmata archaeon]
MYQIKMDSVAHKVAVVVLLLAYILAVYYIISAEMIVAWRLFEIAFIIAIFIVLFIRKDERGMRWWLFRVVLALLLVAAYLLFRVF